MNDSALFGKGFHIMAKPMGPICNLDCGYCFYTEKRALFSENNDFRMNSTILEGFIKKYINGQEIPEVQFVWQGGEPALAGIDFYRKAVSLQKKYSGNKKIVNSFQTNGTLLDDKWGDFLKKNEFIVGLSLDGPLEIHDRHRVYKNGAPSFTRVLESLERLQRYDIPYNVLVSVTRESADDPLALYNFFKASGVRYLQFTPVVERLPNEEDLELGLKNASPPIPSGEETSAKVTPWSVGAEAYGNFLIEIFDEWVRNDVGAVFVMNFEWALEAWLRLPSTVCIFSETCGSALALEHNGDLYSCDHYVYPRYRIGNILTDMPEALVSSEFQAGFGRNKTASLPGECLRCDVRFACNGECPRHRFATSENGEPGLSYLCRGYKNYFRHIHPYMKVMKQLIENGQSADKVMDVIKGPLFIFKD